MTRYGQIKKGVRARKRIELPMMDGSVVACDVVPLLSSGDAEILAGARAFAIARGVAEPKDGEPLYELGRWVHTIALGCVDPDSPAHAPQPFFDGGVEQILDPKDGLDRDRIALLYVEQELWQDQCAPSPKGMGAGEFLAQVLAHAGVPEGADLPLRRWRPVMQQSFVHTMARQLASLLQLKSLIGSDGAEGEKSSAISKPNANEIGES